MASLLDTVGGLAGTALNAYTGGLAGPAAAALSGGKPSGGSGGGATIVPNQTAEQKSSQTVTTNVTVGDGGPLAALIPALLANRADFASVQGYSAESVLSGRSSIGTYAVIGLLGVLGMMLFRKL